MKLETYTSKLSEVLKQRNQFAIGVMLSMLLNLGLLGLSFKLSSNKHIIVTPPVLDEAFWIENKKVSSSYLRLMADYFSRLLLNTSSVSLNARREAVLSLVDIKSLSTFQHLLLEEEDAIRNGNFITIFNPTQYDVDINHLTVDIIGDLSIFQGKQEIRNHKKIYKIQFTFSGPSGKMLIKGFEDVT
jgi:type IV conjugative transfer system protein TraE